MGSYCDPASPKFFVYNIPICGGFCAPTENPDTSCYRHVSNEYTIPASARFMQLAPVCEHSPCCIFCGKLGVEGMRPHRKPVLTFAAVANVASLILCIVAAISGLTTDKGKLESIPWVKGEGQQCAAGNCQDVSIHIGITARYVSATSSSGTIGEVRRWDDADSCNNADIKGKEMCEKCKDNLLASTSLITGILTAFPTIMTDLQRTTVFGDVNCQNTMGKVTNLFSFATTMSSLFAFRTACFEDLPDSWTNSAGTTTMDWGMGPGFRCLLGAVIIKAIDFICHCLIPTPPERWHKPTTKISDVTDYMKLCGSPVEVKGVVVTPPGVVGMQQA